MFLLKEININDILILNKLIFKFKLPLFKNQSIYWSEGNYISFEFTIYIKPHNCTNHDMHALNKFSFNPNVEYEPPVIQKLEKNINPTIQEELLFDYYVCDINTFLDNFYFLNKSHVDYLINIKAFLLDFDDILIYNDCKSHIKFIKELFYSYDYDASFYIDDNYSKKRKYEQMSQNLENLENTEEDLDIEPPTKKFSINFLN